MSLSTCQMSHVPYRLSHIACPKLQVTWQLSHTWPVLFVPMYMFRKLYPNFHVRCNISHLDVPCLCYIKNVPHSLSQVIWPISYIPCPLSQFICSANFVPNWLPHTICLVLYLVLFVPIYILCEILSRVGVPLSIPLVIFYSSSIYRLSRVVCPI